MKLKTLTVDKSKLYLLAKDWSRFLEIEIPPEENVEYHKRVKQGFPCIEYELSFTTPGKEAEGIPSVTYKVRLFPSGAEIRFELDELFPGDPPDRLLDFPIDSGTLQDLGIVPS